ncbi:hypothetical protein CHS0354_031983 [Potamilus streckersoni]|uniref:Uncharacterized protein n=1 Tax=Potamilus streckersoni TaxID=2493646 RepID=A0AAE0TLA2_9BIVA|nr:hypothetical protein CHS0354_031983 [Potamilus streckersoni]
MGGVTDHIPDIWRFRNLFTIFANPLDGILTGNVVVPDPHDAVKDLVNLFEDIGNQLQLLFDNLPDLTPSVHCQNHNCKICMAIEALCMTTRYDAGNKELSLLIDINGYTVLNEKISKWRGGVNALRQTDIGLI